MRYADFYGKRAHVSAFLLIIITRIHLLANGIFETSVLVHPQQARAGAPAKPKKKNDGGKADRRKSFIVSLQQNRRFYAGGVPSQFETTASICTKAFIGIAETPTTVLAGRSPLKNVV